MAGRESGYYHRESEQEGFLVLSGECIAIVEARYGVPVPVATDSPREAYADRPQSSPVRSPWPRD